MAKVRHSNRQAISTAQALVQLGDLIQEKFPFQHIEWEFEAVVDQDFQKDLQHRLAGRVKTPAVEVVGGAAEGGLGVDTDLEQTATIRVKVSGGARNWIEPNRS